MKVGDGYPSEMSEADRHRTTDLDDRTVEALLAGRTPAGREDLRELASALTELRVQAQEPAPHPNAALLEVFAEPPVTAVGKWAAEGGSTAPSPWRSTSPRWRKVPRMLAALFASLVAKISVLGMGAKAALALTAAGAAAGGAVAVDLPDAVADALGRDRGAEQQDVEAPDAAEFGRGVADDASDPNEPGVDGPTVADEARRRAEERRGGDIGPSVDDPADDAASDGLDEARDATDGTGARIPDEVPTDGASQGAAESAPDVESLPGSVPPVDAPPVDDPPTDPAAPPPADVPPVDPPADVPSGPPAD